MDKVFQPHYYIRECELKPEKGKHMLSWKVRYLKSIRVGCNSIFHYDCIHNFITENRAIRNKLLFYNILFIIIKGKDNFKKVYFYTYLQHFINNRIPF